MIVRNEEAFLGECLDSVQGIVDEMVIVDTGSTDRTVEIAEAHGAKVYRHEWTDSFAEARNHALEHATEDWVLVLDADERLDADSGEEILRAANKPTADAYDLVFRNYLSDGPNPDVFVHRTCRLFRNRPEYRYRGRVHELITPSIVGAGGREDQLDAVVHHYGYRPQMMAQRNKHERYVRMLRAELEENPRDVYWLYNLAVAHLTHGEVDDGLKYLELAAEYVTPNHKFASRVFASMSNALCTAGKPEQALDAACRGEKMQIADPELSYCKGNALVLLQHYEQATEAYEDAIRSGRSGAWIGDAGVSGYKAQYGIASAQMGLGNYHEAADACKKALAEKPDDDQTRDLLAAACLRLGLAEECEEHLLELARLESCRSSAAVRFVDLGRWYSAQGRLEDALRSLARAVEIEPACADAYFAAGDALYSAERYLEAADLYQNGLMCAPNSAEGFLSLGNCYFRMRAYEAAAMAYRQALEIRPDYSEAAINLGKAEEARPKAA
jgi:tetratricopeptide (TPR) repeat protein